MSAPHSTLFTPAGLLTFVGKPAGERHWCAKISSSDVADIREQRKKGVTTVALAKTYSVNPATISRIARGIWRKEVSL